MVGKLFLIFIYTAGISFIPSSDCGHPSFNCGHPSSVIRHPFSDLNRQAFYKAMASGSRALVDAQISLLQTDPGGKYEAFEGALSMKKAGFIGAAHTKIHLFRDGHKMLESAIRKDTANAEYRFLRLMIQEHAPPFLGYNKDIQKDSEYIRKMYRYLPEDLQQAIVRYNKKSKNLKLDLS
jgi:hypothetical protein